MADQLRPLILLALIPGGDIEGAQLIVEGGGHAVHHRHPNNELVGTVRVRVDEARSHRVPRGIDGLGARDLLLRDGRDLAVFDPDVPNGIKLRLRVHHTTVHDDDVVAIHRGRAPVFRRGATGDKGQCAADKPKNSYSASCFFRHFPLSSSRGASDLRRVPVDLAGPRDDANRGASFDLGAVSNHAVLAPLAEVFEPLAVDEEDVGQGALFDDRKRKLTADDLPRQRPSLRRPWEPTNRFPAILEDRATLYMLSASSQVISRPCSIEIRPMIAVNVLSHASTTSL